MNPIRIHPITAGLFLVGVVLLSIARGQQPQQVLRLTPEQREILSHMSIVYLDDGQGGQAKTIRFTGVNVQVVNGLGATNGYPDDIDTVDPLLTQTNGVGNLIVGYNELGNWISDVRTGSHNLVVGSKNGYSRHGGIVAARNNTILGAYSAVAGGSFNTASGDASFVVGDQNRATSHFCTVVGGSGNEASFQAATVVGGMGNRATHFYSLAAGGQDNEAAASNAVVVGGTNNRAAAAYSSVTGGEGNQAFGVASSVGGGLHRSSSTAGVHDWVAGSLFEEN